MNIKKIKALALLVSFGLVAGTLNGLESVKVAHAENLGSVVINEVAWAGSLENSNDEWIELYNTTGSAIDLSGWLVEDDYADTYVITAGTIPAHGYFLIEDTETSVPTVTADAIIGLSLANSGDTLILKNSSLTTIDTINASGGAWYAGNNTTKETMERIDPLTTTDVASNFATSTINKGTPKAKNSTYAGGSTSSTKVEFNLSDETPIKGDTVTATVVVSNVADLFAYGFDLNYDATVLEYTDAIESAFLSGGASGSTAFNVALLNGQPGALIIGNAKLGNLNGISGSGDLFSVEFNVIGESGTESGLIFGGNSFLASSSGDIMADLMNGEIAVGTNTISSISGLVLAAGTDTYSLKLNWTAPTTGADSYIIERKKQDGSYVQIATSTTPSFIDSDSVAGGGKIIPQVTYFYRVKAVKNGIQSAYSEISGQESRGIIGDNDRSNRVDGRDIEKLAKKFGLSISDGGFDAITDTNYDGIIDGRDLIEIGANFGLTYAQ